MGTSSKALVSATDLALNSPMKPPFSIVDFGFRKHLFSDRHAGLDPASSNETLYMDSGFRVKPGMTKSDLYF
jgi:hypothetical protein